MKNHLFARIMRASGRLLLFVGAIFGFGLTFMTIYQYFYRLNHPDQPPVIVHAIQGVNSGTVFDIPNPYLVAAITAGSIVLAGILIYIIAKIYNRNMRSIIARLARLFHAQIFTVELVSTGIVWTIATLFLVFTIPFLSIATIFAFIINELLFIFAWGAYGQPNYKI